MKLGNLLVIFASAFVLISCSQKSYNSNPENQGNRDSDLLSFSCETSFEPYLDLDSVLQTIPDTLGFDVIPDGDSLDIRLNNALRIEHEEWVKHYKNPMINSIVETNKSIIFEIEFTGGGIFEFVGDVKATPDSLLLYYCEVKGSRTSYQGSFHDARYILTYEVKKKKAKNRAVRIVYQRSLGRGK
ncbi:MAG: hypothetical protein HRT58_15510 [Crocinitomicaceae bacterium]|nr:hypothetical protein [Flavobacteriales bacterium]NQZ37076.1 hypothetical protein [Crocinitomicaceae bacterium]